MALAISCAAVLQVSLPTFRRNNIAAPESGRVLCHEHRRSTRRCATVLEMKEGPSGSAIRSLIPSHRKLLWPKATVVSVVPLDGDYLSPSALERAYQLACKAVQLDANLPQAHDQLGHVLCKARENAAALGAFERAMALNPNFTDWRFGEALVYAGDPARAIDAIERHMRLDPFYAPLAPGFLGLAYYMLKQYSQALLLLQECVSRMPNSRPGHCLLPATYAQLGNTEKARAEVAEVLRIEPKYTIEGTQARLSGFKRTEDAERYFDGLRKAGLPER
jgi:adenylate cyclase